MRLIRFSGNRAKTRYPQQIGAFGPVSYHDVVLCFAAGRDIW